MNVEKKVKELLSELSGEESIETTARLQGDLALDSLMMVTLLDELEDTFGIELDEADMNPFDLVTVQDVIDLAEKYGGDNYEEVC